MADRSHPTRRTTDPIGGRLDQQPPLVVLEHVRTRTTKPAMSSNTDSAIAIVINHQGSPSRAAFDSRKEWRSPWPRWWIYNVTDHDTTPAFIA